MIKLSQKHEVVRLEGMSNLAWSSFLVYFLSLPRICCKKGVIFSYVETAEDYHKNNEKYSYESCATHKAITAVFIYVIVFNEASDEETKLALDNFKLNVANVTETMKNYKQVAEEFAQQN